MATEAKIQIYDTTLRDGTQGEGVSFPVGAKLRVTEKLDQFGIDYIEGGWPGSNPRDMAYFEAVKDLKLTRNHGQTWENFKTLIQSPGVASAERVEPPPLSAMVRGASGPEESMSDLPDGFTHYHYHEIYFSADGQEAFIFIRVGPPIGSHEPIWRSFPTAWLYE